MATQLRSIDEDAALARLAASAGKDLLRFITCGSVDDGKSTLIGRLLYDSKMLFDDQLAVLEADSRRGRASGSPLEFSLLVDGLAAEREQGITIDVAYRFFATEHRKFIVADTPGHEQYTRNMVTGASTADAALILVDARKGLLTQTRRHSFLAHLLGIRNVVLAVNKMDLVGYDPAVFEAIAADYRAFASRVGIHGITAIPIAALAGENVTRRGDAMPWYAGATLLEHLHAIPARAGDPADAPFRMPVQLVSRVGQDFRGYAGTISSGCVRRGEEVEVAPSGARTHVARIVTMGGDLPEAVSGQSVTLTFADEVDCSRGDLISASERPVACADQFEANLVWLASEPLVPGREYLLKLGSTLAAARIQSPKHKVDVNTLEQLAARTLSLNEIGSANISIDRPIPFESWQSNPALGRFILIDRASNATVGAGMINHPLRRGLNVTYQRTAVTPEQRARMKDQEPAVIWLTGLSGAGKTTIANILEQKLAAMNRHTFLLDGDNLRHGLNRDLGFTDTDRIENIRRAGEVATLMADAGLIVIAAFISPFRAERDSVRQMMKDRNFTEVHIDAPLELAEQRDPKGLYAAARAGRIKNLTGLQSAYEAPLSPELRIDTSQVSPAKAADRIIAHLKL